MKSSKANEIEKVTSSSFKVKDKPKTAKKWIIKNGDHVHCKNDLEKINTSKTTYNHFCEENELLTKVKTEIDSEECFLEEGQECLSVSSFGSDFEDFSESDELYELERSLNNDNAKDFKKDIKNLVVKETTVYLLDDSSEQSQENGMNNDSNSECKDLLEYKDDEKFKNTNRLHKSKNTTSIRKTIQQSPDNTPVFEIYSNDPYVYINFYVLNLCCTFSQKLEKHFVSRFVS